jgi:hypothetical protein
MNCNGRAGEKEIVESKDEEKSPILPLGRPAENWFFLIVNRFLSEMIPFAVSYDLSPFDSAGY